LTSGDLVTLCVFLSLGTLSTDFTRDSNFATDSTSSPHDSTQDVISSETDRSSTQKFVLECLYIGSGAEGLLIRKWLDREFKLVVSIVKVVSLLNQGLDLLYFTGLFV